MIKKYLQSPLVFFFTFLFCVQIFISCNNENRDRVEEGDSLGKAKFYGLCYDSGQVKKWLSDTAKFKKIVFQFSSPKIQNSKDNFQLIAYILAFDPARRPKRYYVNPDSPDTLLPVQDSVKKFEGIMHLGNLDVRIKRLWRLLTKDGQFIVFDCLYFEPIKSRKNYLVYKVFPSLKGKRVGKMQLILDDETLDPSPPAPPSDSEEEGN